MRHRNGTNVEGPEDPINVASFDLMSLMEVFGWLGFRRGGSTFTVSRADLDYLVKAGAVQLIAARLSGRPSRRTTGAGFMARRSRDWDARDVYRLEAGFENARF